MDLGARIYKIGFVHTLYYYSRHWCSQECPWYGHSQFQADESMHIHDSYLGIDCSEPW